VADEVRIASKVMSERVDGREIFIIIKTEYPAGSSTPGRTYVVGPQGQVTDTYEEMLELLGLDTRARPMLKPVNWGEMDNRPPIEEMSAEELRKEAIESQRENDEFRFRVHGIPVPPDEVPPDVLAGSTSAGSATASLDRAELERGFFDRFSPLPATRKQYRPPDLSGPPEQWVENERLRRTGIFEDEHGDHPPDRDHRPDDEVTEAQREMRIVRGAEYLKFIHPERYEAALDAEKYRTYFQRFPEDALTPTGIKGPRCRFIRANGTKCGSPAVKGGRMCYFHTRTERTGKRKGRNKDNAVAERLQAPVLEVPVLEDDLAIQMAVTNVCRQLASEPLDTKRASLLLYGLQVASIAVRKTVQKRVITKK